MNTKSKNFTTENPSSQCGAICCFDFITNNLKLFDSLEILSKYLDKTTQHTKTIIEQNYLVNNRYVFYYVDDILRGKQQSFFTLQIPKRQIQKQIAKEKERITKLVISNLKNKFPNNFKGVKVYVVDTNGKIKGLLESQKEVSEYFNIKIGTVKSRLNRINDIDSAIKYGFCKKSVFDNFVRG